MNCLSGAMDSLHQECSESNVDFPLEGDQNDCIELAACEPPTDEMATDNKAGSEAKPPKELPKLMDLTDMRHMIKCIDESGCQVVVGILDNETSPQSLDSRLKNLEKKKQTKQPKGVSSLPATPLGVDTCKDTLCSGLEDAKEGFEVTRNEFTFGDEQRASNSVLCVSTRSITSITSFGSFVSKTGNVEGRLGIKKTNSSTSSDIFGALSATTGSVSTSRSTIRPSSSKSSASSTVSYPFTTESATIELDQIKTKSDDNVFGMANATVTAVNDPTSTRSSESSTLSCPFSIDSSDDKTKVDTVFAGLEENEALAVTSSKSTIDGDTLFSAESWKNAAVAGPTTKMKSAAKTFGAVMQSKSEVTAPTLWSTDSEPEPFVDDFSALMSQDTADEEPVGESEARKDPYEWAYAVWRKKGLMRDNGNVVAPSQHDEKMSKSVATNKSQASIKHDSSTGASSGAAWQRKTPRRKGRHSLPASIRKSESFTNILEQWRHKSVEQPLNVHMLSPELERPIHLRSTATVRQQIIQQSELKPVALPLEGPVSESGKDSMNDDLQTPPPPQSAPEYKAESQEGLQKDRPDMSNHQETNRVMEHAPNTTTDNKGTSRRIKTPPSSSRRETIGGTAVLGESAKPNSIRRAAKAKRKAQSKSPARRHSISGTSPMDVSKMSLSSRASPSRSINTDDSGPVKHPESQASRLKAALAKAHEGSGPKTKSKSPGKRSKRRTLPKSSCDYKKAALNALLQGVDSDDIHKSFSTLSRDEVNENRAPEQAPAIAKKSNPRSLGELASSSTGSEPMQIVASATSTSIDPPDSRDESLPRSSPDHSRERGRIWRDLKQQAEDSRPELKKGVLYVQDLDLDDEDDDGYLANRSESFTRTPHGSMQPIEACSVATSRLSHGDVGISFDSPWRALLEAEDDDDLTPREAESRPWRRDMMIRQVDSYGEQSAQSYEQGGPCLCSNSMFSGRDELIEFYLPLMGMACQCGARSANRLVNPEEPTALENILRPWQVEFLAAFGIYRGDQLVKAQHRSAGALASSLRNYRRRYGMTPFRTKSCAMAISIWAKTSKSFVRSIRKQLTSGTSDLKVPNTLYILSSFLEKIPMESPRSQASDMLKSPPGTAFL